MRAVRYHGQGDIRVEEIQEPGSCGVGEVKVRMNILFLFQFLAGYFEYYIILTL